MKKILITVLMILLLVPIFSAKFTGKLAYEIKLKEQYKEGKLKEINDFIKNAPDFDTQLIYVHFLGFPNNEVLEKITSKNIEIFKESWIPPIKNHPTGYFTGRMPVSRKLLEELATIKDIISINTAEGQYKFYNDVAAENMGVPEVIETYGLNGEGVRIGVIDSGFQLDHEDFLLPVAAIDYSAYPDSDNTVSNESTHTGHGTHVAGTILGQGTLSNGVWKGMAPESDWVAIKVGADITGGIYSAALNHSYYAAYYTHNVDLINASLGGWDVYHDGSDEIDQTVDMITNDGCIVFQSSGNEANKGKHYSGFLSGGTTSNFIALNYFDSTDTRASYLLNLVWFDGSNTQVQEPLGLEFFNEDFESVIIQNSEEMSQSPRGTQSQYYSATIIGSDEFYVKVFNLSDSDLDYHIYIESNNCKFANADPYFTLGSPGTADKAITVGAWVTRVNWINWMGALVSSTTEELGHLATFSSRGPRVDGLLKPEITAPGYSLISPRDDDAWGYPFALMTLNVVPNSFADGDSTGGQPADYISLSGTSMSSPAACGAAALLKQNDSDLNRDDFLGLISMYSIEDEYTGVVPNNSWGYGKLNIQNIMDNWTDINESFTTNVNKPTLNQCYPNPFVINEESEKRSGISISFNLTKDTDVALDIYNLKGQKVVNLINDFKVSGKYNVSWNGKNKFDVFVQSGIYFYKLETDDYSSVRKMIIVR